MNERKKVVRPRVYRKQVYHAFGLKYNHPFRQMPKELLEQVLNCADNAARRLILGVSR